MSFLTTFLILATLTLAACAAPSPPTESSSLRSHSSANFFAYISGSGKTKTNTIGLYRLNVAAATLTSEGTVAELDDSNFLAISPNEKFLYATCNPKEGEVAAFSVEAHTGKLTPLNQQFSAGHRSVHVSVDPTGKTALVANYVGNTVAALAINADGSLNAPTAGGIQTHTGSGPNPSRQPHPFPHSIYPDPTGRFAYSCDLGTDQIYCYKLNTENATLTPNNPPTISTPPGSGPRHMAFSVDKKWAYVITEMGCTVLAYSFDSVTGALTQIQSVSTLPPGTSLDQQTAAEIVVHPNGQFLYASNRGPHSSIALFAIEPGSGKLLLIADTPSGGQGPRFFTLDPTATLLFVGNQLSDNVSVFCIHPTTGQLTTTGMTLHVPAPMCIVFKTIK